ncbi:restriction endonuclease subunit S, partial [Enterococcus faecalis]
QIERVMGPIFAKSITSSGNSSNKLDPNHFLRQQVLIPKLEEQKKIGLFLKKIDDIINLHQNKLTQLKSLKKSYLQNMFI